jgi:hypothetical protein
MALYNRFPKRSYKRMRSCKIPECRIAIHWSLHNMINGVCKVMRITTATWFQMHMEAPLTNRTVGSVFLQNLQLGMARYDLLRFETADRRKSLP